jgi:ABC transporter substrate binding protein (PQQ-dependent alcohol dehydrogenase system)
MRLALLAFCLALSLMAWRSVAAVAKELVIGVADLKPDARYSKRRTFARYLVQPLGRPGVGADVALKEVRYHGAKIGATFSVKRLRARSMDDLTAAILAANDAGQAFFLVDIPEQHWPGLIEKTAGRALLLFNITAQADVLRQEQCAAHLLHVIPNDAMLMDGLAQFLSLRRWRRILALVGPTPRDQALQAAFERAAKRFGLKITDRRPFLLSNDPRERDRNNLALLTRGDDYDAVFVADSDGEFARDVPYQTKAPRPVVGAEGLAATAWHWAWERHGAPQLEKRFEKLAGRPMRDGDWAAWIAVKAVAEAVQRTQSTDFETLKKHLLGPDMILDGFKGHRSNFRPWDNQLRQPILVGTHNRVLARAPIDGFLHQINNLDTLGFDRRESRCALDR